MQGSAVHIHSESIENKMFWAFTVIVVRLGVNEVLYI